MTRTAVATAEEPPERRDALGKAARGLRAARDQALAPRRQFYVLRTGSRTGVRAWDGPYSTKEQAKGARRMLIDRKSAFITERVPE